MQLASELDTPYRRAQRATILGQTKFTPIHSSPLFPVVRANCYKVSPAFGTSVVRPLSTAWRRAVGKEMKTMDLAWGSVLTLA